VMTRAAIEGKMVSPEESPFVQSRRAAR